MIRIILVLLLVLNGSVGLADTVESGHARFLNFTRRVVVDDDFTYEIESDVHYVALTDEGARQNGRYPIAYNKSLTSLEILEAETVKADGRRIPVPESSIVRQTGIAGQMSYHDIEIVLLTFADFAAGDSVHVRYRTRHKPTFPGYFSFEEAILEALAYDKLEVVLEVPAALALHIDNIGLALQRDETRNGRRSLLWSYRQRWTRDPELARINARVTRPHLFASSFPSWESLANAYAVRHVAQRDESVELIALASELTQGITDTREKVRRIYDWVRKNIRYVAIYAALDGWIPHRASEVLSNRYGDCKDHAVLLEALLRAVGVDSVPVIIASNLSDYRLPPVVVPVFNHVISYVPALDLYLDSTSVFTEFGRLPPEDQGKPVLRGGMVEALGVTPVSPASERRVQRTTRIIVNSAGGAREETAVRVRGDFREWLTRFQQEIGPGKENVWAQKRLIDRGRRGTSRLSFLKEKGGWVGFVISNEIENYLREGDIGLIGFFPAHVGPASIDAVIGLFEPKVRNSEFLCQAVDISETVEIRLPDTLSLLRLPADVAIDEGETLAFRATYSADGRRYTMKRDFRWAPQRANGCTVDDWKASLETLRNVGKAARRGTLAYEREIESLDAVAERE